MASLASRAGSRSSPVPTALCSRVARAAVLLQLALLVATAPPGIFWRSTGAACPLASAAEIWDNAQDLVFSKPALSSQSDAITANVELTRGNIQVGFGGAGGGRCMHTYVCTTYAVDIRFPARKDLKPPSDNHSSNDAPPGSVQSEAGGVLQHSQRLAERHAVGLRLPRRLCNTLLPALARLAWRQPKLYVAGRLQCPPPSASLAFREY